MAGAIDPDSLLSTAFEEAAVCGAELIAVHCWNDELPIGYPWPHTRQLREHWIAYEIEELRSRLTACAERYPQVQARPVSLVGRAATSILYYLRKSPGDELPATVIVGTRGLGRLAGFLVGSTSHTLMTHAPCAVTVIPHQGAPTGTVHDPPASGEDGSAASPRFRTLGSRAQARTSRHDQRGCHRRGVRNEGPVVKVREVMTSPAVTVRDTTPADVVARILAEQGFAAVPVPDANDGLVGIASEDLLREA